MGNSESLQPLAGLKAPRGGSREAVVEAAERLFLERGFGTLSMDDLAEAAGAARRMPHDQFPSRDGILREMILHVSGQMEDASSPGIENRGNIEDVLCLIAQAILDLHARPGYRGFLRMGVADSRQIPWTQFPWTAEALLAVMAPQPELFAGYLAHLTEMGVLDYRNPVQAIRQFTGILNEYFLWSSMMRRVGAPIATEEVIEDTIRVFPQHYRRATGRTTAEPEPRIGAAKPLIAPIQSGWRRV